MDIEIKLSCSGINWKLVADTLRKVEMGYHDPGLHKKAFENRARNMGYNLSMLKRRTVFSFSGATFLASER